MSDWASWLGRTARTTRWLDAHQANLLRVTLDREPSLEAGDELPLAWQWIYFPDMVATTDLGEEGHPRLGLVMPPVPLTRRMWGAGRFEWRRPLRLGTEVTRVSTIEAIEPKQGRRGPLFLVTVRHDFLTAGQVDLVEYQTIVYREMAGGEPLRPPEPAPDDGQYRAEWDVDEVTLFRYSALTFNGHRIHYDVDYCRRVEGYPGLVVHGPLEATLLCDLLAVEQIPVGHFAYTAKSPLFLPHRLVAHARRDGEVTTLWVSDEAGGLHMTATAQSA